MGMLETKTKVSQGRLSHHRALLLAIWLMTLIIIFSSLHYEYIERLPVNRYIQGKQQVNRSMSTTRIRGGRGRSFNISGHLRAFGDSIHRFLLTKADYPLTLTAPFTFENPHICSGNVTVLIVVKTSPGHFVKRSLLRQSFGSQDLFKLGYNVRIAFLLGLTDDRKISETIKFENELYHDIVQAEFNDAYRNLTLKGVMGFRWISHHCSHAELVIKMDDDVFINIFQIMEFYLPKFAGKKQLILCNTMYPSPIIRIRSKWKVENDFFRRQEYFPAYCSGFTAIFSTDTIKKLFHAAQFTPFFWVDDVYLTGLLPSKYNISLSKLDQNVSLDFNKCVNDYNTTSPTLVSCGAPEPKNFFYFWDRAIKTMTPTMRKMVNETFIQESLKTKLNKTSWLKPWT